MKYCAYYLVMLSATTSDRIEDVPHKGPYRYEADAFAEGQKHNGAFFVRYVAADGYMYIDRPRRS